MVNDLRIYLPFNLQFNCVSGKVFYHVDELVVLHLKYFCAVDFDQIVEVLQSGVACRTRQGDFFDSVQLHRKY